ncbi:MAG: tetratricopeptide repeat protein, partial [Cyanobacteria bacterium J06555_13]
PLIQLSYCLQNWPDESALVLIVVDDIDAYEKQLKDCLRGVSGRFKFLLTSRQRFDNAVESIFLEPLTTAQASAIFESILPSDPRLEEEAEVLNELCEWIGCLPLAIQLIGNYLSLETFASIEETYAELQRNSLDDIALDTGNDVQRGAKAAFELSWQQLPPEAKHLGCFLSLFSPAPIPWTLIAEAANRITGICDLRLARLKLIRTHLLKQINRKTVQLHRLSREFFRSKLEEVDPGALLGPAFCQVLLPVAIEMPEKPLKQDLLSFTETYLHIEEVIRGFKALLSDEEVLTFQKSLLRYYYGQGRYKKARHWAEKTLAFASEAFGPQHEYTAHAYRDAGLVAFLQGRIEDAITRLETAFEIQEKIDGQDSLAISKIQILLAVVHRMAGKLDQARTYAHSSLATREKLLEENNLDLAEAKMTVATIQLAQGQDLALVETWVTQVLSVRRQFLPADHPEFAETLNLLAKIYEKQERHQEAESLYVEAKEINEQIFGFAHPQTAFSYNNLAKNYQTQKRYTDAEELLIKAVEILKKSEIMPVAGWCLRNLAMLRAEMQELDIARDILLESIEILHKCLPPKHPYLQQCEADLKSL